MKTLPKTHISSPRPTEQLKATLKMLTALSPSPRLRCPEMSTPAPEAMAIDSAMSISISGTLTAAAAIASVPSLWPMNTPSTIR